MALQLPRLTTEVDCGPLGYPGLTVVFWLNPPIDDYEQPEKAQKWQTAYYHSIARVLLSVHVPAEFSDTGPLDIPIGEARALYDLEHMTGFDPQIIVWSLEQYRRDRDARLKVEVKN